MCKFIIVLVLVILMCSIFNNLTLLNSGSV